MELEIKIDSDYKIPKAVIFTDRMTDEVNAAVKRLTEESVQVITGIKNGMVQILDADGIYRIYSGEGKVFAVNDDGEFILKRRLYEMEEMLEGTKFVRISSSEMINLKKVKSFDLNLTGTICVKMKDGSVTYVSRRYVSKIKKILCV